MLLLPLSDEEAVAEMYLGRLTGPDPLCYVNDMLHNTTSNILLTIDHCASGYVDLHRIRNCLYYL